MDIITLMANGTKLTLAEAAIRLELDVAEVLGYIAAGLLPAEEDGEDWLIDPNDLDLVK